jgi:RimJ/RimL family protein N-acetyltransferase
MSVVAEQSALALMPRATMTARGCSIIVGLLEEPYHDELIDGYLAYQPKGCFQGLPPVRKEVCEAWVRQLIEGGVNLVAISGINGRIVGHAAVLPEDLRDCELLVVVWQHYQNLGIGTELVQSSIDLCGQLGVERLALCVEAKNVRARHVYEKCGFQYLTHAMAGEVKMARWV